MGTYVFFVLTGLLAAALVISGISHERSRRASRLERIKADFGNNEDTCHDSSLFDNPAAMLKYMKDKYPDAFCIDDITVSDLSLRDLYSRMNRCVTNAGEEYLYCRFRILSDDTSDICEKIERYRDEPDRAVKLISILDRTLGKPKQDGYANVSALRDARHGSITADIIQLVMLGLSLCLIAFSPVVGIIATLVMICVSIWGYFRGKRLMDDDLTGFATAMRTVRTSRLLAENGCEEFIQYNGLNVLLKGNFLISVRDQTSSSPLSIVLDYVKMITHIDIIIYKLKISQVVRRVDRLEELYCEIGRLDCSLALASYISGKKICRAGVVDNKYIKTKQIYHPLVRKPVFNDFTAHEGVLITGSNASGKSTFLKAVAVNVLFARSFGLAFADSFETGRYKIYTSMALSDNILKKESYYVVEARSIKRMCDIADSDCLFIIDEVLKGTNTVERIAAGANILKFLCSTGALVFAATHDRELTTLLDKQMDLYHFTEEIREDTVTFPFVIKKGVSDTTNAIRLLAMLGFDRTITSSADSLVEHYNQTGSWT